ncbi:MAG: tetratricopeptide repeat protein [Hyphomicrobiaceae bacterium]|nr:tetratricopeptide repeat protein [Hyphomicrobiaceae bacterium]
MRPTPSIILCAVTLVLAVNPAAATQDRQQDQVHAEMVETLKAYAVYKMGLYDEAFERWLALAEKGNAQGILNIGNMYQEGKGVPADAAKAFAWFLKGAEQGDPHCLLNVARAYASGLGVGRDGEAAERYFREAAGAGSNEAQRHVGKAHLAKGATEEARYWLRRAADNGDAEAVLLLGGLPGAAPADRIGPDAPEWAGVKALVEDLDAAASVRDPAGLTAQLASDAKVEVKLPGEPQHRAMSTGELQGLWRATFDSTNRYRFTRARFDAERAGGDVRITSVIDEYLTTDAKTRHLRLDEVMVVSFVGSEPSIRSLRLTVTPV